MLRKAIISTTTAALVLTGSALGLAGTASAAPAAPASVSAPSASADETPAQVQVRVQQLADSFAEGARLHGKNLRKNQRLWQHGPVAGVGTLHIVTRLKNGNVLGTNDDAFVAGEPLGGGHQFRLALPNAKKYLKKKKSAVVVNEVYFYDNAGRAFVAVSSTKVKF